MVVSILFCDGTGPRRLRKIPARLCEAHLADCFAEVELQIGCRCRQKLSSNGGINIILRRNGAAPATKNTGTTLRSSFGRLLRRSGTSDRMPLPPKAELEWWYQYYFATERGRAGYEKYRHDFAKLIWQIASPKWNFRSDAVAAKS